MTSTHLIFNADDFGQSPGINQGVFRSFEDGVVTSASLMVLWPGTTGAARFARANPDLSVGLHLDFGEWIFDGAWRALYQVVPLDDPEAVAAEIARQVTLFVDQVGKAPSHIDSHQHVHREEPVRSAANRVAADLGVPLRDSNCKIRYVGGFYGQNEKGAPFAAAITPEGLIRLVSDLGSGTFEIGCHPGDASDLETMYRAERSLETDTLCDATVAAAMAEADIHLISFQEISGCRSCLLAGLRR